MRLGDNIFGGRTYHDPLIYRDLMRQASVFGGDYGSPRGQALPALRADGYPAGVTGTNTPGAVVIQAPAPAGAYAIRMEGKGVVALQWGATQPSWRLLTSDGSGAMTTTIDLPALPVGSQVTAVVRASDPADPVRNLSIAMPGEGTFRAEFLADITGFAVHRHMDSRRINADPAVAWADQPASGLNSLWRGVPFEDLCAMANETGADPWFCIPYHADAGYIESMARLIDASLDAGRKVYVEYSNELWNWGFEQAQAVAKWDADNPPSVGRQVVIGRQAAAAMARFRAAMSSSRRCIRVVSGQAGWIEDSRVACLAAADLGGVDAIACAPYFASFSKADMPALTALGARWAAGETAAALDGLFAMVGPTVETALSWTRKWRALADQIGVPLHLYECGQHLNSPDDAALTSLMVAANRDARMGPLYTAYLDGLRDAGVDVACLYNSHGAASRWGSWGLREWVGQPDSEAPKAAAVRAWMDANPVEPEPVEPDPEPVDPEPVDPTPTPEPVDPEPPAPRVVLSVDVVADADGALSLRLRP